MEHDRLFDSLSQPTPGETRKRTRTLAGLARDLTVRSGQFLCTLDPLISRVLRVGKLEQVNEQTGCYMVSWLECGSRVATVNSSFLRSPDPVFERVNITSLVRFHVFDALLLGGMLPESVVGVISQW